MSHLLTGRRSSWVVLGLFLLLALAAMGGLRGSGAVAGMDAVPDSIESSQAAALDDQLDDDDRETLFTVVTRADDGELSDADSGSIEALREELAAATGQEALGPMPAEDGRADLIITSIDTARDSEEIDAEIDALRELAQSEVSGDLEVAVTGGPAVASDIRGAFAGANFTLLAVTIAVVGVLLLLTYRSPVLWLVPLSVIGLAERVSSGLIDTMGEAFELSFDAGVISVLVFGAGTNYALLLISRYREELHATADHRSALARAWRHTIPAILASNLTVVLALLTLTLATMPATRGIGLAAAAGLIIALLAVIFPLTAFLAVLGRRIFWPFVPRPASQEETTTTAAAEDPAESGPFAAVARTVTRRPLITVIGALALLGVLATGLLGTRVGLSQDEQFATANESQAGFAAMAEHYGAGESAPHLLVTHSDRAEDVTAAAEGVDGIDRVAETGQTDDGWSVLSAVGTAQPESPAALDEVRDLREAVRPVDPGSLVGGTSAQSLDVRETSFADLATIAPLILLVVLIVLMVLLRAVVAPVILMVVNLLSSMAAIGLGLWVGQTLFDIPALDVSVPLLAYLFLVALGVDYTMFLVHRARAEAREFGTRAGMVRAVGSTGVVITSAGVVLAAVFAALGVLPLVVLGQLGLIVGLGVLLDTLLVRTVLVPSLFAVLGDRMWWPSRPATGQVLPGAERPGQESAGDDRDHQPVDAPRR